MSSALIQEALDERLKLFSWSDPDTGEQVSAALAKNIAWSGVKFSSNPEVSWLRATLLETAPMTKYIGGSVLFTARGFYEIQCRRPERFGQYAARSLADAVAAHFFPTSGARLYLNARNTLIVQIEEQPAIDLIGVGADGGFIATAVRVRYFAQVPRA